MTFSSRVMKIDPKKISVFKSPGSHRYHLAAGTSPWLSSDVGQMRKSFNVSGNLLGYFFLFPPQGENRCIISNRGSSSNEAARRFEIRREKKFCRSPRGSWTAKVEGSRRGVGDWFPKVRCHVAAAVRKKKAQPVATANSEDRHASCDGMRIEIYNLDRSMSEARAVPILSVAEL